MISFETLKARLSVVDVAEHFLNQKPKQEGDHFRIPCLGSNRGGDRAIQLYPDENTYKCWGCNTPKGDIIGLVAHSKGIGVRQAGEELAAHFKVGDEFKPKERRSAPAPAEAPKQDKPKNGFDPSAYKDKLVTDHDTLKAVGFTKELCELSGVGIAPSGLHKDRFTIPVYTWDPDRPPDMFISVPVDVVKMPRYKGGK